IVYLPASFAAVFLEKSKYQALVNFFGSFEKGFWRKASFRTDVKLKNQRLPYLSSESFLVFDEGYRFIFDWVAVFLNVSLNILALGVVLESSLVYSYLTGICLVAAVIYSFRKKVHDKASEA